MTLLNHWFSIKDKVPLHSCDVLIYVPCDCRCACEICSIGKSLCKEYFDKLNKVLIYTTEKKYHEENFHGVRIGKFEKRIDGIYISKYKETHVYLYKFYPAHPSHWMDIPEIPK